jgi:hypothetical protein
VGQQRSWSVTRCDRGNADGSDARTGDLPTPAVDSVELKGVDVKVNLDAVETVPPDRQQLAIGLDAPDEAQRGDQEGDVAAVLPSTDGDLPSHALESPPPPSDPAAGHLSRLRIPRGQTCSGMDQGHLARLENHPDDKVSDGILTPRSQHRQQGPGCDGSLPPPLAVAEPAVTTRPAT